MSWIQVILPLTVLLCGYYVRGGTLHGGVIRTELVLRRVDSPFHLTTNLVVEREGILTVEPGVVVAVTPGVGITIRGTLNAKGTENERILFTKAGPESSYDLHPWPEVRLVDGTSILEGRLQVLYKQKWRSVCSSAKNWTIADLRVVCSQLGFSGGRPSAWFPRSNNDSSQLLLEQPGCTGEEERLDVCSSWQGRQMGSGVCDFYPDVGITCDPFIPSKRDHWAGLRFEDARSERHLSPDRTMYRRVSFSIIEHVSVLFAGRNEGGFGRGAIEILGIPPRIQGLEVKWSAFSGINATSLSDELHLKDTVTSYNRGDGLYVNSTAGELNTLKLTSSHNGAAGVRYIFHDTHVISKDRLCETGGQGRKQVYPLILTHQQDLDRVQGCEKIFEVDSSQGQTLTVHFPTLISDEVSDSRAARIRVYDGSYGSRPVLADFPVLNNTRPQSLTSSRSVLVIQYIPPLEPGRVFFTLEIVSSIGRSYDVNLTDSNISNNNGQGVVIENMRSGIVVNRTDILANDHVAGIHVLGGSGDVVINNTLIGFNKGDGLNISSSGGFRHIDRSQIVNNTRRGLTFWHNETSNRLAFNFSSHITYSTIAGNGMAGVHLGNICRSDSFWNISLNNFFGNQFDAINIESCWANTFAKTTHLITNNKFSYSRWLALRISPILNSHAILEGNLFSFHERGVIFIENCYGIPNNYVNLTIQDNTFKDNKGFFVAKVGLLEGSEKQVSLITKNQFIQNVIYEPFPKLSPRSRAAAVLAISSSNIRVLRNRFQNPESRYELASHLNLQSATINASLNYFGTSNATAVYERIFDRKDRYNLALVEFLQFLTHPTDLNTETVMSHVMERDKIAPFQNGNLIGGEVAGDVTLSSGTYRVHRDIFIKSESQLILHPGTILEFEQAIGIMNQGRLVSEGLEEAPIKYTMSQFFTLSKSPVFTSSTKLNVTVKPKVISANDLPKPEPLKMAPGESSKNVRLSGRTEGKLEVLVNGKWGSVCAYGWDIEDAAVVCHQLGLVLNSRDWLLERSQFQNERNPKDVVITNVQCTEIDTNLAECKTERQDDFENSCHEEVGIRCYPPSWAGVRFGMEAKESYLKYAIVEQAGLLDYSLHQFKAALQVDFNRHKLEHLILQDNSDSGLSVMWNDVFVNENRKILRSDIKNNQLHGIEIRSQGINIEESKFSKNTGSAIHYDPHFSQLEQIDLLSWLNYKDSQVILEPIQRSSHSIFLSFGDRKYLSFKIAPHSTYTFNITTDPGKRVGVLVLKPFSEISTETLHVYGRLDINPEAPVWSLRENLTSFPLHSPGFGMIAKYSAGANPDGSLLLYLTSVESDRHKTWEQTLIPSIHLHLNYIQSCKTGFSSMHYNRDVNQHGDHYHRYSNETIILTYNEITGSEKEAIYVWTPFWDPLITSLAEINYTLVSNIIHKNNGGLVQYNRDIRNSNNLFHWVINDTKFYNNFHSGIDLRFPYVWQYTENYTHSVAVHNCSFNNNKDFVLSVSGHFARFNMSNNVFSENNCRIGLIHISGMEKEMLLTENKFVRNMARYVIEFNLQSHADRFGVVPASFTRNLVENNRDVSFDPNSGYQPSSYTVGIRGVQPINLTRNVFENRNYQFELLTGVLTGSLDNVVNVKENWWGTIDDAEIQARIFDFDDWNSYAVANYSPYLGRANYDAGTLTEVKHRLPPDINVPLGGRIYQSLTLPKREQPYIVKTDLTIMPGAILRIEEGVTILFHPSVGILVLGDLIARGTRENPIKMKAFPNEKYYGNIRPKRQTEAHGVRLCKSELCTEQSNDGFLEIYNSTTLQWAPICDPRFTERNAQVVCQELGYKGLKNVIFKTGPRDHLGPTHMNRIRSWPHPLECSGSELEISACEFRLNGVRDSYTCSHFDDFVYIYCGEELIDAAPSHWGGIRFSIPSFESNHTELAPTLGSYRYLTDAQLEFVEIHGAGILHGERNAAIQAVNRDVHLHNVVVSQCAFHGIELIAPPGGFHFRDLIVKHNLGLGMNVLILNGESSEERSLFYTPLDHAYIPYTIFGMVDICDTNKVLKVNERVLVYYKYDNRPVDCVKIFQSSHYAKMVGFRFLYFNLFNATGFSSQPDYLKVFNGDIFNDTTQEIGNIFLWKDSDKKPDFEFYRSSFDTLSVKLHASGGGGNLGFIAEVVTIPISHSIGRRLRHNITRSEFIDNQLGALNYETAGESTPFVSFNYNRIEENGLALFSNFTSSECAIHMDLQNCRVLEIHNNLWLRNQGGLCIDVSAHSTPSSVAATITNNIFVENANREILKIEGGSGGQRQLMWIVNNYFTRNIAPYRSSIILSRVLSNFTNNVIVNNLGLYNMEVRGFEKVPFSHQYNVKNSFFGNKATYRSTIYATSPGQKFRDNYLVNQDNDFEIAVGNRTSIDSRDAPIDADFNWWGFNGTSAVAGRILDDTDYDYLLRVQSDRFFPSNASVLSGKCAGGWEKIDDTCFFYFGGVMTFHEAKRFCELSNASLPYIKHNVDELEDYMERHQWRRDYIRDAIWIQSIDIPLRECAILRYGRVRRHNCYDTLPFLCERDPEITVSIKSWYQETLSIAALSISAIAALLIFFCLGCWICKSRQRYIEKMDRRNSIRASIRSNRNLTGSMNFSELGYKRRLEQHSTLKLEPTKMAAARETNGSVDSINKNPPSRFSSSLDDTQSYDTMTTEARNPIYNGFEDRFAHDTRLENATVNAMVRPTFDLTYENRGFMERSVAEGGSREWSSSGTDSTLDMKRSIAAESKEDVYQSSASIQSQPVTLPHRTFGKQQQPLETAM